MSNESVSTENRAFSCLTTMRDAELQSVGSLFTPRDRVLELGGGSGYQARCLSDWGCDVLSIDVGARAPSPQMFFPVTDYDGHHIPAPDASFDVVFSSNTLEHIPHLDELLAETRRVLRSGGRAIHVLPSPAWRLWASATFPVYALGYAFGKYRPAAEVESVQRSVASRGRLGTGFRALLAPLRAHGEYPNALAELYYFSIRRWRRVFSKAGFSVHSAEPIGLFYTPYKLMNQSLTTERRRALSRWLGSSCNVFVLSAR